MIKKEIKNNKGFTIVETLVAITILMIAIAGPLTTAFRGLTAAVYARDQVTASYLAQDAMEYVKNVRDNNWKEKPPKYWLNGFDNCSSYNSACYVSTLNGDINLCSLVDECYLSVNENGYRQSSSGNKKTQFTRKFYITPTSNPDEVTATVVVAWKNGTVSNAVTLSSQLFNVKK